MRTEPTQMNPKKVGMMKMTADEKKLLEGLTEGEEVTEETLENLSNNKGDDE